MSETLFARKKHYSLELRAKG